ncbi:hypothetical protein GCM10007887_32980 [Methylobacterium haplocladii]|uniref:Uncharacterized protein n=1 Tax=Methylobacterium haplocladii TaxID=1176176 RepID=A0A512IUB6_9HYPH|nr:hypothetical protein MHA02_36430 [Methylobacterium haplocladii]GLS60615.1 hypothetical protein GCM10007887_32980 [Methylobacterium haplocladii]
MPETGKSLDRPLAGPRPAVSAPDGETSWQELPEQAGVARPSLSPQSSGSPMASGTSLHRPAVAALLLTLGMALSAQAQPGDIKGQDVMGDKNKSANDGWSQAPVPREESASKDAENPGGNSMSNKSDSSSAKTSGESSASNNGSDDPQKPLDHRTPNPSGSNPASPTR